MKTFTLDFNKDKIYYETTTDEYLRKYQYITPNFRGLWAPNTEYDKGDVVIDSLESRKFYIIYFKGISNNNNSPVNDDLEWEEYNSMSIFQMTNFNEILVKGDISKYRDDSKYHDVINIGPNMKIEEIAYDYYNNIDYWDIILVLNNLRTYLDLPQTEDIIIDKAMEKTKKWGNLFGYNEIDYSILKNKIEINKYGRDVGISSKLLDENSNGLFNLEKNNAYEVLSTNKIYLLNKQIQQKTRIEFDPSYFPLNTNDVISFRLNNTDVTFVASGGESISDVISGPIALLAILNSSNFDFVNYPLETDNNTYITISANMSVSPRFYVSKNVNNTGSIPDAFKFSEDNILFNTNDALSDVNNNYLTQITDTFQNIDMDDPDNNKKYTLLYNTYVKYFDEFTKINDELKFLKVLKRQYVDEFKTQFFSKRTIIEALASKDL